MQISQTLRPTSILPSLNEPDEPSEENLEGDGDDAGEVDGDPRGVDDGLFALQGPEFDEELAARIMVQDQLSGDEDHVSN